MLRCSSFIIIDYRIDYEMINGLPAVEASLGRRDNRAANPQPGKDTHLVERLVLVNLVYALTSGASIV